MEIPSDLFSSARDAAVDVLHQATAIYTCEPIVDKLLDRVRWPAGARSLVDTSCGDGAFLRRALGRLLKRQPGLGDSELLGRISGWEIHPAAAEQARRNVADLLEENGYERGRARGLAARMVIWADFLVEGPFEPSYDTIVGNPPYLRLANVPELLRRLYQPLVPDFARADLLYSFLDRMARVLRPDGELASVTADRWLLNAGAARLREVMGEHFRLAHVERLDVASAFYKPKLRRAGSPPRVHPCAIVLSAARGTPITAAPIYPGLPEPVRGHTRVLGDVATIRLAPWLGTPGIFLLNADIAARLPREALVPAVDTDDVRGGVLRAPTRFAIRTRPGERPADLVMEHLSRELPRMCPRGRRPSSPWLPPEPFHDLDLDQPSLLVPRIAKSLRPVVVPAGVLPISHNLSIVRSQEFSLEQIADVLASQAAQDWMQLTAAPLESDYRSITTRLLRQLPIP